MTTANNDIFTADPESSPLAERCRPRSLSDIIGHDALLADDAPLIQQMKAGYLPSIILWGPPGVGKTTLSRVIAQDLNYQFRDISAVSSGVKDLKELIREARSALSHYQKKTVLFIDEIHRFNKTQQDALLHAVEKGEIVLVGATTENPSFEVNAPLLSRCTVLKLENLTQKNLMDIINRALEKDIILSRYTITLEEPEQLIFYGSGDARRTLNLLEAAFFLSDRTKETVHISGNLINKAASQNPLLYDKKGEYHYDTISAFIKSVRGSDPDASVYWLARMLESGEDPLFIARRLIILASEDIGNAEPYALSLANAGFEAVRNIGMPEARIILAQVTTYLASMPKSNAAYKAIEYALKEVRNSGSQPVPLHLRNAPTNLMKELNYGGEYKYPHDYPGHYIEQNYLPDSLKGKRFYEPTELGRENKIKQYLANLRKTNREDSAE